ncbi:protein TAPETUM DETERMINANT 1-like [Telopea speciosissima]|uniref:protein TAPETUM DETERMINANT 1-like n=1 Tax=Telopea speciosissima TaxID=54955 RepID=UPI001CC54C9A|nr:protein TAPETUM DETERMINANT 1-like [Telopea speciosissima]
MPRFSSEQSALVAVLSAFSLLLLIVVVVVVPLPLTFHLQQNHPYSTSSAIEPRTEITNDQNITTWSSSSSRRNRLLLKGEATAKTMEPKRIWGDQKCTKSDIAVSQGPGLPLPNGIPTYIVEITNLCLKGCRISRIHLSCGWFSSARLINPKVFKRIHYNDCLLNDGKFFAGGHSISFKYANSFYYPLAVSSIKIIC